MAYCIHKKVCGNKICWLKFSRESCMRESLTRENVFVQEADLKTWIFLPANFTGYTVCQYRPDSDGHSDDRCNSTLVCRMRVPVLLITDCTFMYCKYSMIIHVHCTHVHVCWKYIYMYLQNNYWWNTKKIHTHIICCFHCSRYQRWNPYSSYDWKFNSQRVSSIQTAFKWTNAFFR